MKRLTYRTSLIALAAALALAGVAAAERGDDSTRKSKNGKTTGTIDGVEVTVEYGRPNVKGRTIWGDLVPYSKVWRTGADEATTISFSADVLVEGERLAAGTYALFTIPGEGEWAVVFNSVSDQWGTFNHDASKDVLKVMSQPQENEHVESMDFVIEGSSVVLRWAELAVPFAVAAAN
jgi:hypothetical protein